jgi:hypothetical protein
MEHDATVDIIVATRGRGALIEPAIRNALARARGDFTLRIVDQSRFHRLEPEQRDERS